MARGGIVFSSSRSLSAITFEGCAFGVDSFWLGEVEREPCTINTLLTRLIVMDNLSVCVGPVGIEALGFFFVSFIYFICLA